MGTFLCSIGISPDAADGEVRVASMLGTGRDQRGGATEGENMSRVTLSIQDVTAGSRLVKGNCTHNCPGACATVTEVRSGQPGGFRGEPDLSISRGWASA